MKKIALASNNKHKIKEFREILKGYEVFSLADIGYFDNIEEKGETFEENALIKATALHEHLKKMGIDMEVLADDSGLCVDALNGGPGVFSARYCGDHEDSAGNRRKLLENLKGEKNRNAHFTCVIVHLLPDGTHSYVEGQTFGRILEEEVGDTSFGYDCLFYSNDLQKCFGLTTPEEKNSISHRARALAKLKEKIL